MPIKRKDLFSCSYNGGRLHVSGEEVALLCLPRETGHPRYRWENISFIRNAEADPPTEIRESVNRLHAGEADSFSMEERVPFLFMEEAGYLV